MALDFSLLLNDIVPLCDATYGLPAPGAMVGGWKVQSVIKIDKTVAANALARLCPGDPIGDSFGLVAVKNGTTAVAFRGTECMVDLVDDFDCHTNVYAPPIPGSFVEEGFLSVFRGVSDSCPHCPSKTIVTGHSLGGAIALLFAYDLAAAGAAPDVYTLAGPRVGNAQWANAFDALVPVCYRVVNHADPVPRVPLELFGFRHVGTAVEVDGPYDRADLISAHRLDSYKAGLEELQQKLAGCARQAELVK